MPAALNFGSGQTLFAEIHRVIPESGARADGLQQRIARFLGVDTATVSRWATGHTEPPMWAVLGILRFLSQHYGAQRAADAVFGDALADIGLKTVPASLTAADPATIGMEVIGLCGSATSTLARALAPESDGGRQISADEAPEVRLAAESAIRSFESLLATLPGGVMRVAS